MAAVLFRNVHPYAILQMIASKEEAVKSYIVKVQTEREEDGRWSAWAPDLPGCATWGYTEQEALTNIQEAVRGYIQTLVKNGLSIPPSVTVTDTPVVSVNVSAA